VLRGKMLLGRVYDHVVSSAAAKKQLFNELTSIEEITDSFSSFWEHELSDKLIYDELGDEKVEATIMDFGDNEPAKLKDSGIKLAQKYITEKLPQLDITYIQKRFSTNIDGINYIGYPDLVLNQGTVVADHKVRQKKMSDKEIDSDLQLTSYGLLLGGPIKGEFHQALDQKELKIEIAEKIVEQWEIDWLKNLIKDCYRLIQNGVFPPNPLHWSCSLDGCDYFLECKHPEL
jgi:hypothetical protein